MESFLFGTCSDVNDKDSAFVYSAVYLFVKFINYKCVYSIGITSDSGVTFDIEFPEFTLIAVHSSLGGASVGFSSGIFI